MSKKRINIAIIGATGFTGLDLVFLLSKHPKVKIVKLCATKNIGKEISFFDKRIKKKLPKISSSKNIDWSILDLVFLSLPNGEAQKLIKKVYYKHNNLRFIDLSADFRIKNQRRYKSIYKISHSAPSLQSKSIYAISEFVKDKIKQFRIIANPGCYPTSIQLPLIPLLKKKLIKSYNIIIDSKSGYSGAGKNYKKKFTHKNFYSSIFAYNPKNHRHTEEIQQQFFEITKKKITFTFNPQILPTFRGILTTVYVDIKSNISAERIRNELVRYYKKDSFIKILKLNSLIGSGNVQNTNFCEISICNTRIKNRLIIFSAIDNLIKGASGQAIQNMNLIFGFKEKEGL